MKERERRKKERMSRKKKAKKKQESICRELKFTPTNLTWIGDYQQNSFWTVLNEFRDDACEINEGLPGDSRY